MFGLGWISLNQKTVSAVPPVTPEHSFEVDDTVYLQSTGEHKGIPSMVVRQTGPVSYEMHQWHGDQLRACAMAEPQSQETEPQAEQDGSRDRLK